MKINYIVIPLITILVASVGNWITSGGMDWYGNINLPAWTPAGSVIGIAWTIIFILTTISALIVWNRFSRGKRFNQIFITFAANAFLNVFWSFIFFGQHLLFLAVIGAALLGISVVMLIVLIRRTSRLAALLLYPYAIWAAFATYLTYAVWLLN